MRRLLVLCLAAALVACGGPEIDPNVQETSEAPSEITTSGAVTLVGGQDCINEEAGYRIRFPQAWFVNDGSVAANCRFFDDEPVQLQEADDIPVSVAITLGVVRGEFATFAETPGSLRVDEQRRTTIAGREAVVQQGRGTGDALVQEDTLVYRYVVDLPGPQLLLASTYDREGELDFERKIEVLDAMMGTLELRTPAEGPESPAPTGS